MNMNGKKSAVIRIVAWSTAAVALIIVLLLGIFGKLGGISRIKSGINISVGGTSYSDADKYIAGGASIENTGISEIEVNWVDGAVTITPHDENTIQFSETSSNNLDEEDKLHYYVKEGCLKIQYKGSGKNLFSWKSNDKKLELKLPRKLAESLRELEVDTVSSEISITGITADEIKLDSTSGDTILSDIQAGELEVDTISGEITGTNVITQQKMDIGTTSGNASVAGSFQEVEFDSVSGELKLDTVTCPRKVETSTTSGNVTLAIPEEDGFSYRMDSTSGNMNCEFPVTQKEDGGTYNGGGASFQFDSVSGDVTIKKGNGNDN